jgi:hypothetical protein
MAVNDGKASEQKAHRSLKMAIGGGYYRLGAMARRIPDTYELRKKNHDPRTIAPQALGDFLWFADKEMTIIEVKSSRHPVYYDYRFIKDHQLAGLLEIEKCGGNALILFHAKCKDLKKAWMMSVSDYCKMIAEYGTKSYIRWEYFDQCSVQLKNVSSREAEKYGVLGNCWDLRPALGINSEIPQKKGPTNRKGNLKNKIL